MISRERESVFSLICGLLFKLPFALALWFLLRWLGSLAGVAHSGSLAAVVLVGSLCGDVVYWVWRTARRRPR